MLLLIEHDREIPLEKPDSDDAMQPELIACIKEISQRHHLLVDHYNKLKGDFKNYEKTSSGHSFLTPEKKHGMQNVEGQVVPSELSLRSDGGISVATPNEGSESSLLSSDSDSESCDSSPEKMLKHEYEMLMRRILDYEKEVKVSKEKLGLAEDEIARQKKQLENKEAIIANISCIEGELEWAQNQIKMNEADMEEKYKRSLILQRQILDLEAKLELKESRVEKLEKELLDRDSEIEKLKANFALQKQQLESSVSMLSESLQKRCESFEAEKLEMLRNQESLKDNIEQVKVELRVKNALVDTMNKDGDKLKLNYEMKLQTRDDHIECIEQNLKELRCENDGAKKVIGEMKSRMNELEKEVGMQKNEIREISEEKREAIRQLCFSVDHFRSVYQEMRDLYVVSKRRRGGIIF